MTQGKAHQAVHVTIVTVLALSITATIAIVFNNVEALEPHASFVAFIFMSGTIGGIANNFRRLQRIPATAMRDIESNERMLVTLQIYLSPLIGGVFGTTLYGLFMSGLLQGDFFPTFQNLDGPFVSTPDFADTVLPATNGDAAKALLWAFVAGFAEQFVPNFIDKVSREHGAQEDEEE